MSIRPEIGRSVEFEWLRTMIYLLELAKHFALSFLIRNIEIIGAPFASDGLICYVLVSFFSTDKEYTTF